MPSQFFAKNMITSTKFKYFEADPVFTMTIAVVKSVTVAHAIYHLILAFHRVIDNYCEILMALIGLLINHGTFSLGVRDGESGRNIVFYVRLRTSFGDKIPFSSTIFRQIDTDVKAITCT